MKKLKHSIGEVEFKKLLIFLRGDERLKSFTKDRYLKIFTLLYYSGVRLNELSTFTNKNIKEILSCGETKIYLSKTDNERMLYFSSTAIKDIAKLFTESMKEEKDDYKVIRAWNRPYSSVHHITLIQSVNKYIQFVLGSGYSSHSFRQGLITDMACKSVNPKIIQSFIGHKSIRTTLSYVKPTKADVVGALVR